VSDGLDTKTGILLVAVPADAVDELVIAGLAEEVPPLRGAVFDTIVSIGVDSSTVVTLMQTSAVLRAFAVWVTGRARKQRDGITITGRRDGREFTLEVHGDGSVPVDAVADFLSAFFDDLKGKPQ
jgi:hypothetical protein